MFQDGPLCFKSLPIPAACLRAAGKGNAKAQTKHVESDMGEFSDAVSITAISTKTEHHGKSVVLCFGGDG